MSEAVHHSVLLAVTAIASAVARAAAVGLLLLVASTLEATTSTTLLVAGVTVTSTVTAVSSSTAVTASTSTVSTSSTTRATSVGEVDADPATVELLLVETGDSVVGLNRRGVGDEAEATRASGVAIAHHDRIEDLAVA